MTDEDKRSEYSNSTVSNRNGYLSPAQMSTNEFKRRERVKRIASKLKANHERKKGEISSGQA